MKVCVHCGFNRSSQHLHSNFKEVGPNPIWWEQQAPTIGARKGRADKNYNKQIAHVLQNLDQLREQFYSNEIFAGPSLYFHKKLLETDGKTTNERKLEYIYATLTSWGMHRMGKGGSKMLDFATFLNRVVKLKDDIEEATKIDHRNVQYTDCLTLKKIFCGFCVMKSGASIVGNSKVMAHLMPKILLPIDRTYTLKYFGETISYGLEYEWSLMMRIIERFFVPIATNGEFLTKSGEWSARQVEYPCDASNFKIVDKLIIAAVSRDRRDLSFAIGSTFGDSTDRPLMAQGV